MAGTSTVLKRERANRLFSLYRLNDVNTLRVLRVGSDLRTEANDVKIAGDNDCPIDASQISHRLHNRVEI